MKTNLSVTKALAQSISAGLKACGQELPSSNVLELIAKAHGYRTWHAYQADAANNVALAAPVTAPTVAAVSTPAPKQWAPAHGPMSNAQYVAREGGTCPVCGAMEISGSSVDINAGGATQEVSCGACDSSWNDVYVLTGWQPEELGEVDFEKKFLFTVLAWLKKGDGDLTEEYQEIMDELVVQACTEEVLEAVNRECRDSDFAEGQFSSAEAYASSINNSTNVEQLEVIRKGFASNEAFIDHLATWFEYDISILQSWLNHAS